MEPDSSVDSAAHVELLAAIGWALSEISAQNVGALPSEGELTVFHASGQSVISILDYVMRIASFIHCSFECYVVAVIFLDRLITANPNVRFGPFTAHRLIITAVVLAVKSIDDEFYRNSFYAYVGGISTSELNRMEVEFLVAMQYNLYVSEKEFAAYRDRLKWHMIESTISPDGSSARSPLTAAPQTWPRGDGCAGAPSSFPEPAFGLAEHDIEQHAHADAHRALAAASTSSLTSVGGGIPTHVAATVSVLDSPAYRRAAAPAGVCDVAGCVGAGATEERSRWAQGIAAAGGVGVPDMDADGSDARDLALRAWVETGCGPSLGAAGAACDGYFHGSHGGGCATVTATPTTAQNATDDEFDAAAADALAWGAESAWPPAPWEGTWPADPWATELGGAGVAQPHGALTDVVPAEFAAPFPEPSAAVAVATETISSAANAAANTFRGVGLSRRSAVEAADAVLMRAGAALRDAEVSDWAAQYGLLGVIAA